MYMRTHNGQQTGLGIVQQRGMGGYRGRGLGNRNNYLGQVINDPPFANGDPGSDPAGSYNQQGGQAGQYGTSWPLRLTTPQLAAALTSGGPSGADPQGQYANPVRNLYQLLPHACPSGSCIPEFIDSDGTPISPGALIARSVQYLVDKKYDPWVFGTQARTDASGNVPPTRHWANEGYFFDNVRPGTYQSPEDMWTAAARSSSSSTAPPASGSGGPLEDPAVTRKRVFDTLNNTPIERLPLAALPFWRQSTYGLPPGQTVGGPNFPPINWSDPFSQPGGSPANPGPTVPPTPMPITYVQSDPGIMPPGPAQINPQIKAYLTNTPPTVDPSQSPGNPGVMTDPTPASRRMRGTPKVASQMVPARTPAQAAASATNGGTVPVTSAASTSSSIMDSLSNPWVIGGIAAVAFFMFAGGRK